MVMKKFALVLVLIFFSVTITCASEDSGQIHGSSPEMENMLNNDSGKRLIENVPKLLWGGFSTYTDDLMVSSALRLCLDHVGEEYSKTFLAGTSGAAFDIGWGRSTLNSGADGAIFAHPGHFEAGIDNLFKAIGREYTIAYKSEPDQLWNVAIQSIDSGHPVIASEWAIDHFAVLAGYDPGKKEFLGRRYSSRDESPEEYVTIKSDALAFIIAIGDKTKKVPRREAVLGALRFAVSSAAIGRNTDVKGQGGTSHGMIYGPAAYTEHFQMIPEQLDPEHERYAWREHVLFWRLDALSMARAYAVQYLQEVMDMFSPSQKEHIRVAIGSYCEMLGLFISDNISTSRPIKIGSCEISAAHIYAGFIFNQDSTLSWCEGGEIRPVKELFATMEGRMQFADWLLKLRKAEEDAINALAKVIEEEALCIQESP